MIFLAFKITKHIHYSENWEGREPGQKNWWDLYTEQLRVEVLEDICHQVLDLYTLGLDRPRPESPPLIPSRNKASLQTVVGTIPAPAENVPETPSVPVNTFIDPTLLPMPPLVPMIPQSLDYNLLHPPPPPPPPPFPAGQVIPVPPNVTDALPPPPPISILPLGSVAAVPPPPPPALSFSNYYYPNFQYPHNM